MLVVAAVLVAALLHATWNAAAHAMPDREGGFFLLNVGVCVLPIACLPWVGLPDPAAWPFVVGSVLVHLAYNLLLLRSYQLGDFGQTYPLARGTAPLVVAVVGVALVGQHLSLVEALGVVTISVGLVVLVLGRGSFHAGRPAVLAALTTGLAIATYTVLDGVGVRRSADPLPYIAWIFALQGPLIASVVALRRRGLVRDARALLFPGLLSGLVSFVAYALVVWAQSRGRLATVASLREVGIVFGAVIGAVLFHERFGPLRVLGSLVVLAGVVLLASHG